MLRRLLPWDGHSRSRGDSPSRGFEASACASLATGTASTRPSFSPTRSRRGCERRVGVTVATWAAVAATLGLSFVVVARSCSYDWDALARYALYFGACVLLPGVVTLGFATRTPVTVMTALALGIPTGFAIEIGTFLGASALGLKAYLLWVPVFWIGAALALGLRRQAPLVRFRLGAVHGPLALALSAAFFCSVLAAMTQMYSESPLVAGLPQRPIFHDWVYLCSRAAAIKQHWPLEDPSLAGTSLQYHYFMMVHPAASSWVSDLEIPLVLLRLMVVPLGAALVAQAFVLGRMVSRRAWGGVLAVWLTLVASELSLSPQYGSPRYLGLFVRWLFVSPTFFFGVVFFGGLLIAIPRCGAGASPRIWHLAWVALLGAAGTGAKGTVLPVLLVALALWWGWTCVRRREIAIAPAILFVVLSAAFMSVYTCTMSSWGAGDAVIEPFRVFQVTGFWQQYVIPWQRWLKHSLQAPDFGTWLGAGLCATAVIAGSLGVRLLGLAHLVQPAPLRQRELSVWLGLVFLSSCAFGTLLHLDANGELYFILLMRVPAAALAAGFLVTAVAHLREVLFEHPIAGRRWERVLLVLLAPPVAAALAVQTSTAFARQREGLRAWLAWQPQARVNDDMLPLYQTMHWVRDHTEPNAVLIANAFTAPNLRTGRGVLVDHTTAGVHYYYSALSERRVWVEGPTYLLDAALARQRLQHAARIFYGGDVPLAAMFSLDPCYILVDHSVGDGATVTLPDDHRVFTNGRFEVFRVPRARPAAAVAATE